MKYLSVSIKTTGPDPDKHTILDCSAVLDDLTKPWNQNAIPTYCKLVRHDEIKGDVKYLAHNTEIIKRIAENHNTSVSPDMLLIELKNFVEDNCDDCPSKITVAATDSSILAFLNTHRFYPKQMCQDFENEVLNPAMYFLDPIVDTRIPDITECVGRAHIIEHFLSLHNTLQTALTVCKLTRLGFYNLTKLRKYVKGLIA